jgi:hypothetical protein
MRPSIGAYLLAQISYGDVKADTVKLVTERVWLEVLGFNRVAADLAD